MMVASVKFFGEIGSEMQPLAGGKGGTLSRLFQAGYPVPAGFVIFPTAFENRELKRGIWEEILACLNKMRSEAGDTISFAVRSSALSEDSGQASFAGEFETVLDVKSDDDLKKAIDTVQRSGQSERVQAYSQAKGLEGTHEVAVVVQQMVPTKIAGVLFTAHPITGSLSRMLGNFVYGSGDQLVSGKANAERFTLEGPKGCYGGPADLRSFSQGLFELGTRLARELGCPQDIEWGIAEDGLYLLQSRPITTLTGQKVVAEEWNDSLTGDYLWSNVNFGEAVPEVMTPLTWDVLRLIFGQYSLLPGYDSVGNIGGRPYLNMSTFASLFRRLGKSQQATLKELEDILYTFLPVEMEIPLIPLSKGSLFSILPNLIRIALKENRGTSTLSAYLANNPPWFSKMQNRINLAKATGELISLWRDEIWPSVSGNVWHVMGTVSKSTQKSTKLRRDLTALVGPQDADILISSQGSSLDPDGITGLLASLGPVIGISRVARGEMSREEYLAKYGHRGPNEFELSVPRPVEDQSWLDRQLAQFRNSPVDTEALLTKKRAEFEDAWSRFMVSHPDKVKTIGRRIKDVAFWTRKREDARSEYVRDRWLLRIFAVRAGELTGLGNDVFFLSAEEMLEVLAGNKGAVESIAARQEAYRRYKRLPSYPSIIRGRFDPFQWADSPQRHQNIFNSQAADFDSTTGVDSSDMILGSPGSAGQVEGRVRRLDHPEQGEQLQPGEILVTAMTDIAWTPLFLRAGAVVTDVGAPLSHAAIVARELGIPAVVGCNDATVRLNTGDRVRVDGGKGLVQILKEATSNSPTAR